MASPHQQKLQQLRNALLDLHKTLVDAERVSYEKTMGGIHSPNHFLQLLTHDPWFAWLHPVSELIVAMDEVLDGKKRRSQAGIDSFWTQTRSLLVATEGGDGFASHYFELLQREPDVVLAHAEVAKLLGPRQPSP